MISDIHADIVSRRTGEAAARTKVLSQKAGGDGGAAVLWTMAVI
jgi:hypothetical protein